MLTDFLFFFTCLYLLYYVSNIKRKTLITDTVFLFLPPKTCVLVGLGLCLFALCSPRLLLLVLVLGVCRFSGVLHDAGGCLCFC